MQKNKIEYLIVALCSFILLEIGFLAALTWYWSGFEWSPLGYETCGMEFLIMIFFAWPMFALGLMIRGWLFFRWKAPHYVHYLPLLMCITASCGFAKSLGMGIFCIISMLALPIMDFFGIKKAVRK